MKYEDAITFIEECNLLGSIPGLDSIRALTGALGNPQDKLKFIHVAGTNGKGSVSSFIGTVLQCGGYKVGRYISPTIYTYRERFQVNGRMIGKKELGEEMAIIKEACDTLVAQGKPHPTSFEIETALAFHYFHKKQCDIVVLETGMGGTLDATNIIKNPLMCILTSISMDHMQVLGDTLTEIAQKKAGIIKKGCTVVSMTQQPEAEAVLREKTKQEGCPFVCVEEQKLEKVRYGLKKQSFSYGELQKLEICLAGQHQIRNAALAAEVLNTLGKLRREFQIPEKKLRQGLLQTEWKGRFTIIGKNPCFVADGAHNEDGARKLAESLEFYFTNKRIIYIMGVLRDKEYDRMIRLTYGLAEHIITVTPPDNPRAMHAYELASEVQKYHPRVTAADSIEEAVELSSLLARDGVVVAFGSLSYLGDLIKAVENRDKGVVV